MLPTCPQCGYDLTGIGSGQLHARCPECGRAFDPSRPRDLLPPWPSPAIVLLLLCVPPVLVYALAVPAVWISTAILVNHAEMLAGFTALGMVLGASLLGLIIVPGMVVQRLTSRHGLYGGGVGFGVALLAVSVNLFVWLCMLTLSAAGIADLR